MCALYANIRYRQRTIRVRPITAAHPVKPAAARMTLARVEITQALKAQAQMLQVLHALKIQALTTPALPAAQAHLLKMRIVRTVMALETAIALLIALTVHPAETLMALKATQAQPTLPTAQMGAVRQIALAEAKAL